MEPRLNELLHVNKNLWCKCCIMVLCYFKTFKFEILTSKQHFSQLVSEKAISANLGLKVKFTIVLTFLYWLFRGLFCVIITGPWSKSSKYRLLPSSKNPHFQNEVKCTTFHVKWKAEHLTSFWYRGLGNSEMTYLLSSSYWINFGLNLL